VRRAMRLLRGRTSRAAGGGLVDAIEGIWYEQLNFRRDAEPDGEEGRQRHASLVTLLGIAERIQAGDEQADISAFVAEIARRADDEAAGVGGGVNLITYHRAKGLEFDAVLLPSLEEGLVPVRQATTPEELAEERRLLYVGLTRARVHLWLGWAARRPGPSGREGQRKPSRFLSDVVPDGGRRGRPGPRAIVAGIGGSQRGLGGANGAGALDGPLVERLRGWRRDRAKADDVPAYVVFNDRTLAALAEQRPRNRVELLRVDGIGPKKVELYGDMLLELLKGD
jgi:DNA helicase II / ATP-dependent DNA helicase PcrA